MAPIDSSSSCVCFFGELLQNLFYDAQAKIVFDTSKFVRKIKVLHSYFYLLVYLTYKY